MEVFVDYTLTFRPRAPKEGWLYTLRTKASLDLLQVGSGGCRGGGGGQRALLNV